MNRKDVKIGGEYCFQFSKNSDPCKVKVISWRESNPRMGVEAGFYVEGLERWQVDFAASRQLVSTWADHEVEVVRVQRLREEHHAKRGEFEECKRELEARLEAYGVKVLVIGDPACGIVRLFHGDIEEAALLAALQAAP